MGGGGTRLVLGLHVGTLLDKHFNRFQIACCCCLMEGSCLSLQWGAEGLCDKISACVCVCVCVFVCVCVRAGQCRASACCSHHIVSWVLDQQLLCFDQLSVQRGGISRNAQDVGAQPIKGPANHCQLRLQNK
jgi:hypothetical protein